MKKTRIVTAIVIAIVVLALLLARCSSSSSSPADTQAATPASEPSEELLFIGVQCETPGEVVEGSGASFVCTPTKKAGETEAIYYGVATPADEPCDAPGKTRSVEGVFSVCADDGEPTKRKWLVTVPMPVAVAAFIESGDSTEPAALEETGVTIPEAIAALPGMQEFDVAPTTTEPATTVAPTTSQATTATTEAATATTAVVVVTTTEVPSTTTSAPTTTEAPAPTVTPTTASPATSVVAPTVPATTTTAPKVKPATCADGGPCNVGDTGPAGGIILLANFMLNEPPTLIEVAPTTWFGKAATVKLYVEKLSYGGFDDWVVPNRSQLLTMRRERARFACALGTRCTSGFNPSTYWAAATADPTDTVSFAGAGDPQTAAPGTSHFIRPIRVIGELGPGGAVLPPLEEA